MKIVVINGANLNKLGERDPSIYGSLSLPNIKELLEKEFPMDEFIFYQSNLEGEIVNSIQQYGANADGIIINPGGYAHTSVVIRDALELVNIPKIEVHFSNLASRDEFRKISLTASKCDGYISGFKEYSYVAAVFLLHKLGAKND